MESQVAQATVRGMRTLRFVCMTASLYDSCGRIFDGDHCPGCGRCRLEGRNYGGRPLHCPMCTGGLRVNVVSQRLGHSSPMITMTVYAHLLPGNQREAANTSARLIREVGGA
jgi:hypothetical protein